MIPYGKQDITQKDVDEVMAVLRSDFLTQGPAVPGFERAVADKCHASHAVAVNSATSALHIACLSLGLGEGDLLWTTPVSFVASANCALYCGAGVDFVDINPETYNLCPERLAVKLQEAKAAGKKLPKVVAPVHLSGQPCDMEAIHRLSLEYGFRIIEDASHAIGGSYHGHPVGSCQYSDITVFSFHPVKIITSGEGGMALTNCPELAEQMIMLRSHGITRDPEKMTHAADGPWYYQQLQLGFNYRMTDIQAALGLSQLERLDSYVSERHRLADRYNQLLAGLPVIRPMQLDNTYSGYHLYIIRLELGRISLSHPEVFEHLREMGIGVNLHYIPIHTQPYYQSLGFRIGSFPESEAYYQEAISLPIFPMMSENQQDKIVCALKSILTIN